MVRLIQPLTSAARTTSGNSQPIAIEDAKEFAVFLEVTAVSGTTPTLDVKLQVYDEINEQWHDLATLALGDAVGATPANFAQVTATGRQARYRDKPMGALLRVDYTIGGTSPSFTFSVSMVVKD